MNKAQMEDRLVKFAAGIIDFTISMESNSALNHLADHLRRSAVSAACHYGEAQSAESTRDFIHKLSIVLKELREAFILLRILSTNQDESIEVHNLRKECDELIRIIHVSIRTSKSRRRDSGNEEPRKD